MLDAHVFDGLQEIAKPIVANIVVSWNFEILLFFFSVFYAYSKLKSIHYLTSFCRKKWQPI